MFEDRQSDGMGFALPITENLVLCSYYQRRQRGGLAVPGDPENAEKLIEDLRPHTECLTL